MNVFRILGDGVLDHRDLCPANHDPVQLDLDGDNLGDECDPDDDGDEVGDGWDNCPMMFNPDQADEDGDRVGDLCERE